MTRVLERSTEDLRRDNMAMLYFVSKLLTAEWKATASVLEVLSVDDHPDPKAETLVYQKIDQK